jgi:hypothetical protein
MTADMFSFSSLWDARGFEQLFALMVIMIPNNAMAVWL